MKYILPLLLAIMPLYINAQNGGQHNENKTGALQYTGYESGHYVLELTNKQSCGVDFLVKWLGKDTTIYIQGTQTIQLPGAPKGNEKIKAKPLYKCGSSGGDMGWLEICTPVSLPITFKSIRAEKVGARKVKIIFDVADASDVNTYNIQVSADGINYKTVTILFPDEVKPNRTYTVTVNL